jgi:hypothetical protein
MCGTLLSSGILFSQTVPGTPVPAVPANAATNQLIHETFSWSATAHAVKYRIQVSLSSTFPDSVVVVDTTITDNGLLLDSCTVAPLQYNTKYYWRLNASSADSTSVWSAVYNFTTVIAPPAAPLLTSPLSFARSVAVSSTFKWSTVTSAATYQIQIDTSPEFTAPVISDTTLTTGSKTVSSLSYYTRYYWRVRAKNVGGCSPWSDAQSFLTLLAAPVPNYPATAAANQPISLTLYWSESANAQTYTLQLSTSSTFTSYTFNDSTLTGTQADIASLSNGTKYYWRLSAKNDSGSSSYSTVFSFTTIVAAPASAPIPSSPSNGAVSQSLPPTLKWGSVSGAMSYQVQIAADSFYTTSLLKDTTIAAVTYTAAGLQNYKRYFWRVCAVNAGGSSSFCSSQSFITELTQPSLSSPASSAANQILPVTFIWTSVPSAARYHLQVSTASTFTSFTYQDSTLTSTSQTVSSLANSTTYYWRVRAKNDTCVSSWISSAPKFTTIIATPAAPALNSPSSGLVNDTISPTLKWTVSANATSYRVQAATDSLFTSPLVNDSVTTVTKVLTTLSYNTTYYWRVNAQNIGGISSYSPVWNFTTTLAAPALSSPGNAATSQPVDQVFKWSAVAGASSYRLRIGTDSLLKTISYDLPSLPSTSDTIRGMANTMKFYWKVNGQNANGDGAASSVWSFTTLTMAPSAPSLTSPVDAAGNQALTVTLQWSALYNAASYRVQVSTDSLFSTLFADDSTLTTGQKQITGLSYNTHYFWRVRGKNASGSGNYSTRNFYTMPSTPALNSPAAGATNQPITLAFSWDSIAGASGYHLQISTVTTFATTVYDDSTVTGSTRTVASLANSTKYYWRVCARNSRGSGAYAAALSFTTVIAAPAAPKLSSPATAVLNQALSIPFKWTAATNAVSYELQVGADSLFSSVLFDSTTTLLTATLTMPLNSMTYYWRVFAKNAGGSSPASDVWNLTTKTIAPAVPQLANPKSGTVGSVTNPLVTWRSSWSAKKYFVQIAKDTPFDTVVVSATVNLDTILQATSLANGTTFYWRVKAVNDSGSSDYSAMWNFVTRLQAPSLLFPYAAAEGISLTPTMKWSVIANVQSYVLKISTDSTFANCIVNDSTLTAQTYYLTGLQAGVVYYWKVGAKDSKGFTAFSDAASFTTIPPPLAQPALLSPASAATGLSLMPAFVWRSVSKAAQYRLQISEDTPFKTCAYDDSTLTDTVCQKASLQYNTKYYWRVMAINAADKSAYSEIWSFTTFTGLPSTPVPMTPVNTATGLARSVLFQWRTASAATAYYLEISSDASFSTISFQDSTITDSTFTGPQLDNGQTYYWRVCAQNSVGKGSFSTVWSFTTAYPALSAPSLLAPSNTASAVSISPVLKWNKVTRASAYQAQIAKDAGFLSTVFQNTSVADTICGGASLLNSTNYFWRTRAIIGTDTSSYSSAWSFTTIIAQASVPVLLLPGSNSYGVGLNTTFRWRTSSDAASYRLQVSDDSLFRTLVYEDSTLTDTSCVVGPLRIYTRYYWRTSAKNYAGSSSYSASWTFSTSPSTGVQSAGSSIPKDFSLSQNYPNPFNPSTMIEFGVPEESQVNITIYNLLGKSVAQILSQRLTAGSYRISWNASHMADGVYFYRLIARPYSAGKSPFMQTKRLVLLK